MRFTDFKKIWVGDFEFRPGPEGLPEPVCLVGKELLSGRLLSLSGDELKRILQSPLGSGPDNLFVCFSCTAELSCFRALGWPYPEHVLDLYDEFLNYRNSEPADGNADKSLCGAVRYFGCGEIDPEEKDGMRDLILGQTEYSSSELRNILLYCRGDVENTAKLFKAMEPRIDLDRALLRGEYGKALTDMELRGVPVDVTLLNRLSSNWGSLRKKLINEVDADYGVFEFGKFNYKRFGEWTVDQNIPWPETKSGLPKTDKETLKEKALKYPVVAPLAELFHINRQLNDFKFPVGPDGRNRFASMPFMAKTGRNQPKTSEFIFGGPTWIRSLVRPETGYALAYIDWERQEFGMGAALSRDGKMMEAYQADDCYTAFGIQAGVVPAGATKATHPRERSMLKSALLSIQYQSSAKSLAGKIGVSESEADQLIQSHHRLYRVYWDWVNRVENSFLLESRIQSVFGWTLKRNPEKPANMRAVSNFPIQANGAEMMRLACCIATENGVEICATLHDAFLIEAPIADIDEAVKTMKSAMDEASRIILNDFILKTESQIFRYPDRFSDPRGKDMWNLVMKLLGEVDSGGSTCASMIQVPVRR